MAGRLSGKVAIVTGAGAGIGRAVANRFAAEGAAVVIAEVDPTAGRDAETEILAAAGKALFVPTDVSKLHDLQTVVQKTTATFGALHILVNNAAVGTNRSGSEILEEDYERVMGVNHKGALFASIYAAQAMSADVGGVILNISSVTALVGLPNFALYASSKGAMLSMTKALAIDLAPRKIRVNAICPGSIHTKLLDAALQSFPDEGARNRFVASLGIIHPLGRVGEPQEIASLALFLASDEASFVTGATYVADGGYLARGAMPCTT